MRACVCARARVCIFQGFVTAVDCTSSILKYSISWPRQRGRQNILSGVFVRDTDVRNVAHAVPRLDGRITFYRTFTGYILNSVN